MPVYTLEILVVALGFVMLMVDAFVKLEDKRSLAWLGVLGLVIVFGLLFLVRWPDLGDDPSPFWQFYAHGDSLSLFFKGIAILSTILVLLMATEFSSVVVDLTARPEEGAHPQGGLGEFFTLPVFACAGLMWMASANNLVSIFVSLEFVTITFYVLVAYLRRNVGSLEAGVKYLVLGALSTGFLVYGFAWLFGLTGSMDLAEIKVALASGDVNETAALFAFALILVAMAFKVGAAPFHLWIPDVYQGAPTPVTAFLSVASKAAGFIVSLRLAAVFLGCELIADKVILVLTVVAILTLVFGNLTALPQRNFKRLLAYSSVAHAGFLLMALASAPVAGEAGSRFNPASAIAFYLGAYLLMTLLAFLVMTVTRQKIAGEEIDSYRGLAKRSPFLAGALLVAMASLAGIPLTAGFLGKLFVFHLAIQQGQWILLAFGILGAAAGFYYYLKIAAAMYFEKPEEGADTSALTITIPVRVAMVLLIVGIFAAGIHPGLLFALM